MNKFHIKSLEILLQVFFPIDRFTVPVEGDLSYDRSEATNSKNHSIKIPVKTKKNTFCLQAIPWNWKQKFREPILSEKFFCVVLFNLSTFWKFHFATSTPGLSYHRYSVIFKADSEIFAFSAMFRSEPADFNFDISGHNWFSDEHFWTSLIQRWTLLASSKQAKTMKKANKKCFSFNIDAEETRNRKFQNNF